MLRSADRHPFLAHLYVEKMYVSANHAPLGRLNLQQSITWCIVNRSEGFQIYFSPACGLMWPMSRAESQGLDDEVEENLPCFCNL